MWNLIARSSASYVSMQEGYASRNNGYGTNELCHGSHHNASVMHAGGMGYPCLMVTKIRISQIAKPNL